MKLRNKKTGEIIETYSIYEDYRGKIVIKKKDIENYPYEYDTLTKLNEEWQDYEEPKEFYYITVDGYVVKDNDTITKDFADDLESIGNYFETEEEAEKAVEKLKAWKRLKDKGFEFTGWGMASSDTVVIYANRKFESIQAEKDLDLLFGGEE
jgi:hypothetical protein